MTWFVVPLSSTTLDSFDHLDFQRRLVLHFDIEIEIHCRTVEVSLE